MGIKSIVENMDHIDPLGIILFGVISIVTLFAMAMFYSAHRTDLEVQAYQEQCIEAGGIPVVPYPHIKTKHNGSICINPSAIIQLKD